MTRRPLRVATARAADRRLQPAAERTCDAEAVEDPDDEAAEEQRADEARLDDRRRRTRVRPPVNFPVTNS